jgi:hypothetical protein
MRPIDVNELDKLIDELQSIVFDVSEPTKSNCLLTKVRKMENVIGKIQAMREELQWQ